jgi:hypothetical protein
MTEVLSHESAEDVVASMPTKRASCPYCGVAGDLPDGDLVKCDECGTMIAHGVAQPRVVIMPHPDPRFQTIRFERVPEDCVRADPSAKHRVVVLKIAKEHAAAIGKNLVSIS